MHHLAVVCYLINSNDNLSWRRQRFGAGGSSRCSRVTGFCDQVCPRCPGKRCAALNCDRVAEGS
ncbi:hypothetical protein DPMN_130546 [Dreissena polymorpha]|uniref:Uncharacterized protein n=1 Tax=Dreissena polymorpha TaxID=45954 RepID=A0A9D4H326_DREPO|nr:hypothetical protein DPMN_130522 [Dreissena polymorpha]KAH3828565.1 hypothetical protein DPMN_130546 [Dreissena polymorpha]